MSEISEIITKLESLETKVPSKKIVDFKKYLANLEQRMKTQVFLDIYGLPGDDTQPSLHLIVNDNPASEIDFVSEMESALDTRDRYYGSPGYDRKHVDGEETMFTFSFVEFLEAFAREKLPSDIVQWLKPHFGWDDEISPQPEMFIRKLQMTQDHYRLTKMHVVYRGQTTFVQLYPIGFEHEEVDELLPTSILSKTTKHFHEDAELYPWNKINVPRKSFLEPYQTDLVYPSRPIKLRSLGQARDILLSNKIIIV